MPGVGVGVSPALLSSIPGPTDPLAQLTALEWQASGLTVPMSGPYARAGSGARQFYGADFASALLTTVAADTMRYDRMSDGRVGAKFEGSRTNLALRANEMGNGTAWAKTGITSADNQTTSPSGSTDAESYRPSASTGSKRVQQSLTVVNGTTYCLSCYFKQNQTTIRYMQIAGGTAGFGSEVYGNFDIQTGVVGTGGTNTTLAISALPNGWYRCEIRGAATASTTDAAAFTISIVAASNSARQSNLSGMNDVDVVYVWGAQFEAGAFRSSLVAPSASTITRAADSLPVTGLVLPASLSMRFRVQAAIAASGNQYIAYANDNSTNNSIAIYRDSSKHVQVVIRSGGSAVASFDLGVLADSAAGVIALTMALNSMNAGMNGVIQTRDTSCTMPVGVDRIWWGSLDSAGSELYGHIVSGPGYTGAWAGPLNDSQLTTACAA